ncbi:MAG: hypothetical protein E7241_02305 [Lachnospiraceae bacterium]|jgi:hypothetical protein|nr:hypothetical protein [Lachnospiraceae bacterium]
MLNNQELLSALVDYIDKNATFAAHEALTNYEKEHPNEFITDDIRKTLRQRANSELMLRMSNFAPGDDVADYEDLTSRFEEWFRNGEEEHLAKMCTSIIEMEVKKNTAPEEEELSFTERYLRAQRANSKPGGHGVNLNDLK